MLNPNEIGRKHLPSMQAAILKNRSVLDEHRVSMLYKQAKLLYGDPKVVASTTVWTSRVTTEGGAVTASCTDVETGLFVQLSGDPTKGVEEALLTFGHKFCQEVRDTMRQNIATKIW